MTCHIFCVLICLSKGGVFIDYIGERISWCISQSGLTKTAFAERINVSQSFISRLASGEKVPSARTIADICREFGISEHWLRTGEGDPIVPIDRDEEITAWVGKVVKSNDDFKKDFIAVLSRLDESSWEVLAQIAQGMIDQRLKSQKEKEKP